MTKGNGWVMKLICAPAYDGSDEDVRPTPQEPFSDRLKYNKEKRGSFSEGEKGVGRGSCGEDY